MGLLLRSEAPLPKSPVKAKLTFKLSSICLQGTVQYQALPGIHYYRNIPLFSGRQCGSRTHCVKEFPLYWAENELVRLEKVVCRVGML